MSELDSGRYSVAAGCVGICQGCVEESVRYAKEREQFGRPIASFQLVQAMIADMVLKTDASRMLVWRAGWLKDSGRPNTLETSVAKLHATEASLECANLAIQVHGGAGYVDDHPVERYFRDARVDDPLRGDLTDPETDHRPRDDGDHRARARLRRTGAILMSERPASQEDEGSLPAPPRRRSAGVIGVLGAGTMGSGIAQLACRAGADTLLL